MASNYTNAPAGTTGYNDPEGTHGPHSSRLANAVDPRVDSDVDHRRAPQTGTTGYGAPASQVGSTHGTHATTGTTTTGASANNTGERVAQGIKGIFPQAHGVGESLRGNINSAIDTLTGDKEKQAHDEEVARGGFREVQNKQFEKRGTDKAL
ncbi:hypothetical protein GE09DRAFT_1113447 [Coniochaeta sp. 2T2.1]|nr:hypothetical protein GE09DRAFT_1113447 [Coniochaeta sp. 2T2.1]